MLTDAEKAQMAAARNPVRERYNISKQKWGAKDSRTIRAKRDLKTARHNRELKPYMWERLVQGLTGWGTPNRASDPVWELFMLGNYLGAYNAWNDEQKKKVK
jgi:hypothetical protein